MARNALSLTDGDSQVWVVAEDDVLSSAIVAALVTTGWRPVRVLTGGQHPGPVPGSRQALRLVLIADGLGRLPDLRPVLEYGLTRYHVVAIGTRQTLVALADAVDQGAAALDADQPFSDLICQLNRELARASTDRMITSAGPALRLREREARRFMLLTSRESDVLCGMIRGESAAQIALGEHLSLTTVRTHVRGILSKLGVSSQVAAVAMARRSCREGAVVDEIRRVGFINFDGDLMRSRDHAGD